MPCTAKPRGFTSTTWPWDDKVQNNPCGIADFAGGLCKFHWQQANGLVQSGGVDGQTVLLLHGESLVDSSPFSHPLTIMGNGAISSAQSKFGGSSLYVPAAGDGFSSPDSPDWAFGAGDFTVDCWVNFSSIPGTQVMVSQFSGSPGQYSWLLRYETGTRLGFYWSLDGTALTSTVPLWTPTVGTWYHVAAVRTGNNLMLFVNGTQVGTTAAITGSLFDSNAPLTVGANPGGGWPLLGYIDEVRVSKGIARWTGNFSVPTAPYT